MRRYSYVAILFSVLVFSSNVCSEVDDPTGEKELKSLLPQLEAVDQTIFDDLRNLDPLIFKPGISPSNVLRVTPEVVRTISESLIRRGWGTMEFLTHPYLSTHRQIFYYSAEVLDEVMREYDFPGIFPPRGRTYKTVRDRNSIVAAGTSFEMSGLLIGDGRVVVLYPHPISVHRDDSIFSILTGNYYLYRVNIVEIGEGDESNRTITKLQGRNAQDEAFRSIRGPLDVSISRLELQRSNNIVRVMTPIGWWSFQQPKIRRM